MELTNQMQYESFQNRLRLLNDEELIHTFNKEVGNLGWVGARGAYLAAIHKEFDRRSIDYSQIGDEESLSLKYRIKLEKGKIYV